MQPFSLQGLVAVCLMKGPFQICGRVCPVYELIYFKIMFFQDHIWQPFPEKTAVCSSTLAAGFSELSDERISAFCFQKCHFFAFFLPQVCHQAYCFRGSIIQSWLINFFVLSTFESMYFALRETCSRPSVPE